MDNLISRQAAIDAIEKIKIAWINVNDKLPNVQENVIVSIHDDLGDTVFDYTSFGWLTPDKKYWIVDNEICNRVTFWMPLPEPPEDDK